MATPSRRVLALIERQARAADSITASVQALIRRLLGALRADAWYDDAAVGSLAADIARVVRSGADARAQSTRAYLDEALRVAGAPARTATVLQLPTQWADVDPLEEFARPARTYRRARVAGLDEVQALEQAEQRAMVRADLVLQRASTVAAQQVLVRRDDVVTGWRRIIHPELSRGGTCGLCVAASDRVYGTGELMPIHARCKCTVLPVVQTPSGDVRDPGRSVNAESLAELYRVAGSTAATALKGVRVQVAEHGELGPLLTRAGHAFRDQAEAAAQQAARRRPASSRVPAA